MQNIWLAFLAAVLAAFSALSQAVRDRLVCRLCIVGRVCIAATLAAGWILFGQRLNRKGWIGLVLLLAGMIMVKLA
ncbi:MAG: SMR family transporter [Escherichia sp.]